ncbi:MAG: galactose-1-phosphate uridylyltransferase [Gemmatimonadales bacterium]|nr:galactose-1-phosphate uridylyltransferase [Gemmatimonadales bacterium]
MADHARRDADFQPELRKNVVTREWVIIARGRGRRPSDFIGATPEEKLPAHDEACPFCLGNESQTPSEVFALREIGEPNSAGWRVRVVPNKFAALRANGSDRVRQMGLHSSRDGFGAHEVIIETPEHNRDLWEMEPSQLEAVLEAYRQRFLAFESGEVLHHVLLFRNHGPRAGTSLVHPHSQLIAAPVMPHQLQVELQGAAAYWEYLGRCVFCALIEDEIRSRQRVVLETDHFVVMAAYAGRYPFETWILPKRHAIRFAAMSAAESSDLARVVRETLGRLAGCLDRPSYNFAIHTAPAAEHNVRAYHWHMEIFPRITTLGGFELGSDIYINVVAPEDAATYLREAEVPAPAAAT